MVATTKGRAVIFNPLFMVRLWWLVVFGIDTRPAKESADE